MLFLCLLLLHMTPPPPSLYTLSLHDALPISSSSRSSPSSSMSAPRLDEAWLARHVWPRFSRVLERKEIYLANRSEEHTSELQSLRHLVCRLLLEKKNRQHHHTAGHVRLLRPN